MSIFPFSAIYSFYCLISFSRPGLPGIALNMALVAYTEKDASTREAVGGFAFPVITILRNDTKKTYAVLSYLIHYRCSHSRRSVMALYMKKKSSGKDGMEQEGTERKQTNVGGGEEGLLLFYYYTSFYFYLFFGPDQVSRVAIGYWLLAIGF
ncbi:uncharacterized protein F4817DRAFT_103910 [Daldinia loculata]|uniref:uncharacterized protein n=1 Tax=Daldinia loculata TaxID=103429 RepID=UPI0020C44F71|nr:uncharacterized protein F4817DRAFT_103910 [Daldinia loculata]KAI1647577.1 hypothetical protein F4817DRAFT_103910 [Daldinia loculata]